jgi:Zn-dependent protease
MNPAMLAEGLIDYLLLVIIITFHEFGHAWMSNARGDDTARLQGRITLNPLAHMELVGTVILPLVAVLLSASGSGLGGFLIGWGRPVPVNIERLHRPRIDDTLVSVAGPAMNVVIAIIAMGLARGALVAESSVLLEAFQRLAMLSMFLCIFNLLPIPPLDGSHILKNAIGMSHEAYFRLSQYGLFIIIVAIQIPFIQTFLSRGTIVSMLLLSRLFGFPG